MTERRRELEIEGEPIDSTWEDVVRACLAKDPAQRPQSVSQVAKELEVPSPKTRRRAPPASEEPSKRAGLFIALGVLVLVAAIAGWQLGVFEDRGVAENVVPPPSPVIDGTPQPKTSAPSETPLPPIVATPPAPTPTTATADPSPPEPGKSDTQIGPAPVRPPVSADAVYSGTIQVKNETSIQVPLAITIGADLKSGTMAQSGRSGDMIVKFTGVWDGVILRAVTGEVVSLPNGIRWDPESFTLRFAEDAKSAIYECVAGGKTYVADLAIQSAPAVNAAPIYKGIIRAQGETGSGTPLTINLGADRKSGTMTQTSKLGETIVRFNGIWDGAIFRAVTNEVISKPKNIQWKPESFSVRFAEDGRRGLYECSSEGRVYTAELSPP